MTEARSDTGPVYLVGLALFMLSGLLVSLYLSWLILSACNFFYPVLHDIIDIQATIEEYAPENIHKPSFDKTTRAQRAELFRRIVYGINHQGKGLETINYADASGHTYGPLLRTPEIVHLQDVAKLLDTLRSAAWTALVVLLASVIWLLGRRNVMPGPRYLLLTIVLIALSGLLTVLLAGVKDTFYQWHTIIFPTGHQWFFYYEESLMTLLMKAPDIFAWIAAMLLAVALVIFYLLLALIHALSVRRSESAVDHPH